MMALDQKHKLGWRSLEVLLYALVLSALGSGVRAQEDHVTVQAFVDRDTATIGDLITYQLTITHPPEVLVKPPQLEAQLGQFEIRDRHLLPDEKMEDGRLRTQIRYLISSFTTGNLTIPPVEITYTNPEGQSGTLSTPDLSIAVVSLNPDVAGDIRDIKPPVSLPGIWTGFYWLVGGLILLAGGIIFWVFLRKKSAQRSLEAVEYRGPPRPAHEIALEELDRVASLNLIQKGLIKQFYTAISEVIKRYIARRYQIQTMELTTAELLAAMKRASVPPEHIQAYQPFFQEGDLVKFAKYIPPRDRLDNALTGARQLVLFTREEPVATVLEAESAPAAKTSLANAGFAEK